MSSVLFIGNFLSRTRGTLNPTERVIQKLEAEGLPCLYCSHFEHRLLRLLHILIFSLFARYDKLHIDTFSNQAFWFASLASRIGRWRRKPVILNLHGGKLAEFYAQNQQRVSSTFRRATTIVSPSRYLINFFGAKGFPVKYLPNSIDLQRFKFKPTTQVMFALTILS